MTIGFIYTGTTYATPDKQLTRSTTPRVLTAKFGDGYEQRVADGINTLVQEFSISFVTRPKAQIDDLVTFFEGLGGVSKFELVVDDTNSGGTEVYKVVCSEWQQTWDYDNFYSLTATVKRVYEA